MRVVNLRYVFIAFAVFVLCLSHGSCQDEDEDDEDTYDEEVADKDLTTTRRTRTRGSTVATTGGYKIGGRNNTGEVTSAAGAPLAATSAPAAPAAQAPVPPAPAAVTQPSRVAAATTLSEYDEDEEPTEEEGYGYIFRPLNFLVDNIVAGNVTGIVDHALSIRTPPEIRAFVNNVMGNVFGAGIGSALKQFAPKLFSTEAPSKSAPERDPIPTRPPRRRIPPVKQADEAPSPLDLGEVILRSNETEKASGKASKPMEIPFIGHPGAPASRLRCEIIN